jgi:hypothetical protein
MNFADITPYIKDLFGKASLQISRVRSSSFHPNRSSSTSSSFEKKKKLETSFMKFTKLFKRFFRNIVFIPSHEVA